MKRLKVRWRLTLWYGAVLTAIVVGFGGAVYGLMQRNLIARADFELDEELTELALEVRLARNEQDLREQLRRRFFQHASFDFRIVARDGRDVFRSERLVDAPLPQPALPGKAGAESFATADVSGLGEIRVASRGVAGWENPLVVQSFMPLAPLRQELRALLATLLAVGPLAILGALAGGYLLARRALAPVEQMAATAERITSARLDGRIAVSNPDDELGRLALTLNEMLDRLRRSVERTRRFTADAAHELRTPLSVLQMELEVALRGARSAEQYRGVIEVALKEARRLTQLANQLLLLARHDDGSQPPSRDEVRLDALLEDVAEQTRLAADEKGVALEVGPPEELTVIGDDIALSRLLHNLLDNGIKFTPAGGQVCARAKRRGAWAIIVVADTGAGIAPDDLPHVFERFYRADKSRNGQTGGAGLGLPISLAIAEAHGGTIRVESAPGRGARFEALLPLAPSGGDASLRPRRFARTGQTS